MPPELPENIRMLGKEELDKAVLRVAIMSEFDCINRITQKSIENQSIKSS